MADAPSSRASGQDETHHFRRMGAIWLVVSLAGDLLFWFLVGPHVPPGRMTSSATGDAVDFNLLFITALPVMFAVWVYMGYAIWNWRAGRGHPDPVPQPHDHGHFGIQATWMATSLVIVMAAFVFGTVELVVTAGAGGGEGPDPIWTPTSKTVLPIQVIAQQWKFTYRYPTFGGFETDDLVIPDHTAIAFHVTSLDVVHSFWAYQIGVKADANPDQDNVAFTTTNQTGTFTVRCSELCGLWHGAMYDTGSIMSKTAFNSWALRTKASLADNTKYLPPFAWTYTPDANGADGGLYPDNVDPYSKVEVYGAQKATT
jgi:cytochrome c oxidase subunit 2